jgi:hypothetical protein
MPACHAGGVTVPPNQKTGFKAREGCVIVPQPVCNEGHLVYLVVEVGTASCFLIYSAAFLFYHIFQLYFSSVVILSDLFHFLSSKYSLPLMP